jgi:hypothetical protein
MLGSNDRMLFPAVAAGRNAASDQGNQGVCISSVGAASSFAQDRLQEPISEKVWQKYTLDISRLFITLKSP